MQIIRRHGSVSNIIRFTLRQSATGASPGAPATGLINVSSYLNVSTICDNETSPVSYLWANIGVDELDNGPGVFETPMSGRCRFGEVNAAAHPGLYELHLDNSRFSVANAKYLFITISGLQNVMQKDIIVQLTQFDVDSNAPDVNTTRIGGTAQTAGDVGAGVVSIKAKTDLLPADPASNTQVNTRLASSGYSAPDNSGIASIKAKTDQLAFISGLVSANMDSRGLTSSRAALLDHLATWTLVDLFNVLVQIGSNIASLPLPVPLAELIGLIKEKTDALPNDPASEATVQTRLAETSYVAPDNSGIAAIKSKTDHLPADPASDTAVQTRLATADYVPSQGGDATEAKQDQILAKLSNVNVTVTSPVASNGTISLVQGNDYSGAAALVLSRAWSGLDLTGATATFSAIPLLDYERGGRPATIGPINCALAYSNGTATVTITLTSAQTAAMNSVPPARSCNYRYEIRVTTPAGMKQTLFLGPLSVTQQVAK